MAGFHRLGDAVSGNRFALPTLVLLAVIAGALWGFMELSDEVMEGDTHELDEAVLLLMRTAGDPADPIGPGWVEEAGRDITALGGVSVLVLITLLATVYLLLRRKGRATALVLVAVSGGLILSTLMKAGFDRPRPDLVPHGSIVHTASFPSGHSMMAAVVYLTLAALLLRLHPQRRVKTFLLASAILLTLLVGVSRVYLGVHWPTDVLAGWTAGAAWASACWLVAGWLQRRGSIEDDREPSDD